MKPTKKRYVFGPVPSRRLGRSLGLDLVPAKTCSFDCIYCQVGRTTVKTVERKEYAPAAEILRQLEEHLEHGPSPDVITLSGSGEPTLHSGLAEIIHELKCRTSLPVAVLTNGSLLSRPEVRRALLPADFVLPNLDAVTPAVFQQICRPAAGLGPEPIIAALTQFAKEYTGNLWMEVFLVAGVNDSEEEVKKIAAAVEKIGPGKVQLNTVTRPAAEKWVRSVPRQRLDFLAALFSPAAEVIADFWRRSSQEETAAVSAVEVLELLRRRPCTLEDIAAGLGMGEGKARQILDSLLAEQQVTAFFQDGRTYYWAVVNREQ